MFSPRDKPVEKVINKIINQKNQKGEQFMLLHFLVNCNESISQIKHRILLLNHRKIFIGECVFSSG